MIDWGLFPIHKWFALFFVIFFCIIAFEVVLYWSRSQQKKLNLIVAYCEEIENWKMKKEEEESSQEFFK